MLSQKYLGLARFCKYHDDFAGFRKLLHPFANRVSQCFVIFRKVRNISQDFAN